MSYAVHRWKVNSFSHTFRVGIKSLERAFLQEGGMRERMTKARIEYRKKQ